MVSGDHMRTEHLDPGAQQLTAYIVALKLKPTLHQCLYTPMSKFEVLHL